MEAVDLLLLSSTFAGKGKNETYGAFGEVVVSLLAGRGDGALLREGAG